MFVPLLYHEVQIKTRYKFNQVTMATKVTLRQKAISKKRQTLYLDYWPAITNPETGKKTRREFLKQYIFDKPKKQADKEHNENVMQLAEQIKLKRENELNKPEIYSELEKERLKATKTGKGNFIEYFKKLTDKHPGPTHDDWLIVYKYLKQFAGENLPFSELTKEFCSDFREYLLTTKRYNSDMPLSQNSACTYFVKFKAAVKKAYKDDKIKTYVGLDVPVIKVLESQRNYLTLDELNAVAKAQCNIPVMKAAALFSALTGLRYGDIKNLTWGKIEKDNGNYQIRFRQQKTKGLVTLPISEQAYSLLGEPREPEAEVFPELIISSYYNKYLLQWIARAGITKDVTFHSFRHTFATLQLTEGTDLFTVSKMLGHVNIKTTAIYAKVVDKLKQDAVNRIKLDL
jgi:integrase